MDTTCIVLLKQGVLIQEESCIQALDLLTTFARRINPEFIEEKADVDRIMEVISEYFVNMALGNEATTSPDKVNQTIARIKAKVSPYMLRVLLRDSNFLELCEEFIEAKVSPQIIIELVSDHLLPTVYDNILKEKSLTCNTIKEYLESKPWVLPNHKIILTELQKELLHKCPAVPIPVEHQQLIISDATLCGVIEILIENGIDVKELFKTIFPYINAPTGNTTPTTGAPHHKTFPNTALDITATSNHVKNPTRNFTHVEFDTEISNGHVSGQRTLWDMPQKFPWPKDKNSTTNEYANAMAVASPYDYHTARDYSFETTQKNIFDTDNNYHPMRDTSESKRKNSRGTDKWHYTHALHTDKLSTIRKNPVRLQKEYINSPNGNDIRNSTAFYPHEPSCPWPSLRTHNQSSIYKPNSTLMNVRALSIKDALDYVPRYDGRRADLIKFVEGCNLARRLVPDQFETELAKLITVRLTGEASKAARDREFNSIQDLVIFFDKTFGNPKPYHELEGELAQIRQKPEERIIVFSNRIREKGREIREAAIRENRDNIPGYYENHERDLLKYFLRGMRSEIRARTAPKREYDETLKDALEMESEICTYSEMPQLTAIKVVETKDHRKCQICQLEGHIASQCPKFVGPREPVEQCQLCNIIGHGALSCRKFNGTVPKARPTHTEPHFSRRPAPENSESCTYCKKHGHIIEACFLREKNNKKRDERLKAQGNDPRPSQTGNLRAAVPQNH